VPLDERRHTTGAGDIICIDPMEEQRELGYGAESSWQLDNALTITLLE